MRSPTSYAPVLPVAIGIPIGIVALLCVPVWCAVVPVALAVALFVMKKPWWATGVLFVAVGMLTAKIMMPAEPPESIIGQKLRFSATIATVGESQQTYRLKIEVDSVEHRALTSFVAILTVNSFDCEFHTGQRINFLSRLKAAQSHPILPGDTDFSLYYKSEGIKALGFCRAEDITVTGSPGIITRTFDKARQNIASAIVSTPLTPECSAFMLATLIGDDALLHPATKETFRRTGISHVLALSGLHVGIIVMIAMLLTLPFNVHRSGIYIRPILAIILVWAYAMLVGMSASVVRAAIMTTVYMLARMIQNGHTGFNSLLISIVVILLAKPMWIFSAGFQLSVCAVASILAFTSLVPQRWQRHPVRYFFFMTILIPIAAILGTGMVAAFHFSTFPLYFLPANIAVGLIIPWLLGLGVMITIFALAGWHLIIATWIASRLYVLLEVAAIVLSQLPYAQIQGVTFHAITILPYFIALVCLWLAIRRRSWMWCISSAGCCAVTMLCVQLLRDTPPTAELYILPDINSTKIVLSAKDTNPYLLLPDLSPDTIENLARANLQHHGFLLGRSDSETFRTAPTPQFITIAGTTLRLLFDSSDTIPTSPRPTYLVVSKGFNGKISKHYQTILPDTILLSPALHPKIAAKLTAECSDTIPVINLRQRSFKIVQR